MGCDIYSMTDRWTDRQTPYKIITKCLLCFVEDTKVPLFWRKKKLQGYPGFEYILHSLLSPLTLHFVISSCSISAEAVTIFLYQFFPAVGAYSCKKMKMQKLMKQSLPFFCIITVQEIHLLTFKQKT